MNLQRKEKNNQQSYKEFDMKHFTPQSLREWVIAVTALAGLITGTLSGGYKVAKEIGWVDNLEKGNTVLAKEHVGEQPLSYNAIIDTDSDTLTVSIFKNGDALVKRVWEDQSGATQRSTRWIPKRDWDSIVGIKLDLDNTAYAAEMKSVKPKAREIYIGQTSEGYSVYAQEFLGIRLECIVVDEATGEIIKKVTVPCEQHIVKPTE